MYLALTHSARRLAATSPQTHLTRTLSVKSGPIPPQNAPRGVSDSTPPSPASANTNTSTPPPPSPSTQSTPINTQNASESDAPAAPAPTTLSLDFAPSEPTTERERTGAKSSKDSLSSIERRRRQLGRVSFGLFALGLVSGCVYLGREWTEDELVSRRSVGVSIHDALVDPRSHLYFRGGRTYLIPGGVVRLAGSRQCSTYDPAIMMTRYSWLTVLSSTSRNQSGKNFSRPCSHPLIKSPTLCCYLSTIYW